MRSKRISFRLSLDISDDLESLVEQGGFKNLSRLMFALCIMVWQDDKRGMGFIKNRPSWVRDLANSDPKDQDFAVRHMKKWPREFDKMIKLMRKIDQ